MTKNDSRREDFRWPLPPEGTSVLATRRGQLTLALLCGAAFMDFVDGSIVNVALPSIRRDLRFSGPSLQWVESGYLLTYGGFMLLAGRAADPLGRRLVLVAGTVLIGVSGFAAWSLWLLVRLVYLSGFQNRLLVVLRWTISFLNRGRGSRLIPTPANSVPAPAEKRRAA
jgi:MFS family permease